MRSCSQRSHQVHVKLKQKTVNLLKQGKFFKSIWQKCSICNFFLITGSALFCLFYQNLKRFLSLFSTFLPPRPWLYPISQVGHLTGLSEVIETKLLAYCILIRFLLVMIKGIWSQVVWISQSSYGIYFLERWNISSVYMVEKLHSF